MEHEATRQAHLQSSLLAILTGAGFHPSPHLLQRYTHFTFAPLCFCCFVKIWPSPLISGHFCRVVQLLQSTRDPPKFHPTQDPATARRPEAEAILQEQISRFQLRKGRNKDLTHSVHPHQPRGRREQERAAKMVFVTFVMAAKEAYFFNSPTHWAWYVQRRVRKYVWYLGVGC